MANSERPDQTRRTFVKTVTYVTPAILTLNSAPALAQNGSQKDLSYANDDAARPDPIHEDEPMHQDEN